MKKLNTPKNIFNKLLGRNIFERTVMAIFLVLITVLLVFFVKGKIVENSLYYQTQYVTTAGSPYDASISAARYALTVAIVDNHSFFLSKPLALLASPDVVYYNGKFTSIFTPGISFFGVPFYIIGKLLNIPQLFTYFSTLLIAIINVFLIIALSRKLGAGFFAGMFAGAIFLFATNALPYALTYTQHHFTVMLILLALLNALEERTIFNNIVFGAIYGIGVLIDIPNLFLLAPIGLYILYKQFQNKKLHDKTVVALKLNIVGLLIGVIPFIILFARYNYITNGSYTKVAQIIGKSDYFVDTQKIPSILPVPTPTPLPKNQPVNDTPPPVGIQNLPFDTRNQLYDFYIFFLSDERSWIFYSPVVFVGLLGMWAAWRQKHTQIKTLTLLALSVAATDVATYTMFGDPWGGWNFGPRYLIPAAAILCLFISVAVEKYKKNIFFALGLLVLTVYSLWVSYMGALTTNSIPPKVEAVAMKTPTPYTYALNEQDIAKNFSSSLFYNYYLSGEISVATYLYFLVAVTTLILMSMYIYIWIHQEGKIYE